MDWQQALVALKDIVTLAKEEGLPIVIACISVIAVILIGYAIYQGIVFGVGWGRGHVDTWIAKSHELKEKRDARDERTTEMFSRSTEAMEQVAAGIKPIAAAVDRMDRRIEEHGVKIDRMHHKLFGEEKT